MARKPSPRGREAPKFPPVRVSDEEWNWALAEAARTGLDVTKLMRNRFFASMPGYVSHKLPKRGDG